MQVIRGMHYYTQNSIMYMGICDGNYKHVIKKSTVIISDNFTLMKTYDRRCAKWPTDPSQRSLLRQVYNAIFEVLVVVLMKTQIFWNVMSFWVLNSY